MTTALEGGEGSASRPSRSLPPGKNRYPLYRRLDGPQGRSGQLWRILSPTGFDPRTVQLVPSRYTDYATRPTNAPKVNSTAVFHVPRVLPTNNTMFWKFCYKFTFVSDRYSTYISRTESNFPTLKIEEYFLLKEVAR
jgi:hypothetical protein